MSKSKIPKLKTLDKWPNGFNGTYKGCYVTVLRDDKKSDWCFSVYNDDGYLADGISDNEMKIREVIVHAIKAAGLHEE